MLFYRMSFSVLVAGALTVAAGVIPSRIEVTWSPEAPVQGTLFTVRARVVGPPPVRLEGRLAGEPLHFQDDGEGGWWAIAAVPVDAEDTLDLHVAATWDDAAPAGVRLPLPVGPGSYAMERLTVAPRFGGPPDSALAARMAEEAERARAVARGAHLTPRMWAPGAFVRPRPSRITSGFGNGREFNGRVQSRHMGTDFAGATGSPVHATADGVVALVDRFHLGGNVVYIDHGGGLSSAYLHLSETAVAEGDTVRAGQRIGGVGSTGRTTGPHLHWIVRYGGITVDPLSLLELPDPSVPPIAPPQPQR